MNSSLYFILLNFILAGIFSTALLPIIRRIGLYLNLVDLPDIRKQHHTPTVRLGGVGIVLSCLLTLLITQTLRSLYSISDGNSQTIQIILIGGLCFFCIGLADDIFSLRPLPRLIGQIIIAIVMWSCGLQLTTASVPYFDFVNYLSLFSNIVSFVFTILWLVAITNAINWFDGLDGLAVGIVGITAISLLSISFEFHQTAVGFLLSSLSGSCFGFLIHNTSPKGIFMGDGGSYFLGFILAASSLTIGHAASTPSNLFFPLIVFALPLIDMLAVIISRMRRGHSLFFPDRCHLHHRLLDVGIRSDQTVLLIHSLAQLISASILMVFNTRKYFLWLFILAFVLLISIIINKFKTDISAFQ
uniref:Glycosyl transferase, family 4 n=1 Tax=Paulinella longichromatophora TaxID=1708747 RepID=A0A2H4ZPN8_9EUKA|nr:Glycosyl transferase, family 4 [Paulinella longichromatophora]